MPLVERPGAASKRSSSSSAAKRGRAPGWVASLLQRPGVHAGRVLRSPRTAPDREHFSGPTHASLRAALAAAWAAWERTYSHEATAATADRRMPYP